VQPNIPLLWDDKQARLARLRGPSAAAQAAGAELIVWPENIYPWPLDRPFERDFSDADRVLAEHSLPTIFGAGNIADSDDYGYNSAFMMAARRRGAGPLRQDRAGPARRAHPARRPRVGQAARSSAWPTTSPAASRRGSSSTSPPSPSPR
jgi:hypothetical protein